MFFAPIQSFFNDRPAIVWQSQNAAHYPPYSQSPPSAPVPPVPSTAQTSPPATVSRSPQELFVANFACTAATEKNDPSVPAGFDTAINVSCTQGYVTPQAPGKPMQLLRNLEPATEVSSPIGPGVPQAGETASEAQSAPQPQSAASRTEAVPPLLNSFVLQFRGNFAPGNLGTSVGFNASAIEPPSTDSTTQPASTDSRTQPASADLLVAFRSTGIGVETNGSFTAYLPDTGSSLGVAGSTDSGQAPNKRYGWSAPGPGMYDLSLFRQADGSAVLSIMHAGTVNNSASFLIPALPLPVCSSPCGARGSEAGLQQFEIVGTTPGTDRIAGALYQFGPTGEDRQSSTRELVLPAQHEGGYRAGAFLRWYITAGGAPCKPGAPSCMNVWAVIPPAYDPQRKNKWLVAAHGYGEDGQIFQQEYNTKGATVSDTLWNQGYVLVTLDNVNQNCYGNQQCVTDIANAVAQVRGALSLEDDPYAMADSMGGEQMLNAITHGIIHPKAFAGFCINTNLKWQNDPAHGKQAPLIKTAYHFHSAADYPTATAGYDPLLAEGEALNRLTSVPMILFESPTDPIVDKVANTDAFAAMLKRAGGNVRVVSTTGGHLAPSNFQGQVVADFFSAH